MFEDILEYVKVESVYTPNTNTSVEEETRGNGVPYRDRMDDRSRSANHMFSGFRDRYRNQAVFAEREPALLNLQNNRWLAYTCPDRFRQRRRKRQSILVSGSLDDDGEGAVLEAGLSMPASASACLKKQVEPRKQ